MVSIFKPNPKFSLALEDHGEGVILKVVDSVGADFKEGKGAILKIGSHGELILFCIKHPSQPCPEWVEDLGIKLDGNGRIKMSA